MMGESVECRNSVQLSVSFGKFENDSLSWEKWSSFSPNKYLEEVGSLSTPGSVAQKKAYFEAHYKKIAAQKAELLELENTTENDPSVTDDNQNVADQTIQLPSISTDEMPVTGALIDTNVEIVHSGNEISNDELKEDDSMAVASEILPEVSTEEIVLVKDETVQKKPQKPENIEDNSKLDAHEKNLPDTRKKKKLVSINARLANNSTRISPKPELKSMSTLISPSRHSAEKSSVSSMSRTKNAIPAKSNLHTSLNLDPSNYSDPLSHNPTRKSVFMEQMGDKDIVKRVFKTFQKDFNRLRSPGDEYSAGHKQPLRYVPSNGMEPKVSTSTAFRKDSERMRHIQENMKTQRGRFGTTWNSISSGSLNEPGLGAIKPKVSSSSKGSRSDERTEKQKFSKKVEEKSYAKETEKTRLRSKSKVEKEVEVNRLSQSLNFKAKPMPDFYRSLNISSERVGVKSGICRRPQLA